MIKFNTHHVHIHTTKFFKTFQLLLTAGFDNKIEIHEIRPYYTICDHNYTGELYGHTSLITSFAPIEKTPMVIPADDKFCIKLWDIRKLACI